VGRILFLIAIERMISSTSLVSVMVLYTLVMGLLLTSYVQLAILVLRQKLGRLALV
jgi:hypothetical protein